MQQAQALGLSPRGDALNMSAPRSPTAVSPTGRTGRALSPTSTSWLHSVLPRANESAEKPLTSRQLRKDTTDRIPPAAAARSHVQTTAGPGFGSLYGDSSRGTPAAPSSRTQRFSAPTQTTSARKPSPKRHEDVPEPRQRRHRERTQERARPAVKSAPAPAAKPAAPRKPWGAPNTPWRELQTRNTVAQVTKSAPRSSRSSHHDRSSGSGAPEQKRSTHASHSHHSESDTSSYSGSYTGSDDSEIRYREGDESDSGSYSSEISEDERAPVKVAESAPKRRY